MNSDDQALGLPDARRTAAGDRVVVCEDAESLAERTGRFLADLLATAVDARGRAVLALAGGATPAAAYERLGRVGLPWERIVFVLGDERIVPAGHPDSNAAMIRSRLGEDKTLHPMVPEEEGGTREPYRLARDYARRLGEVVARRREGVPVLDGALLGLGTDGHFASIFPGSPVLEERDAWVAPSPRPPAGAGRSPRVDRLTLTFPIFAAAEQLAFLVAGAAKADAVRRVLAGDLDLPAGRLRAARGDTLWFLDRQAAGRVAHS